MLTWWTDLCDFTLLSNTKVNIHNLCLSVMRFKNYIDDRKQVSILVCLLPIRWKALQGALNTYKADLAAALEVHSFNRDVDDINDRINEKAVLLSSEELGKDLEAVQSLQRQQEAIERDMTALQNTLEVMHWT